MNHLIKISTGMIFVFSLITGCGKNMNDMQAEAGNILSTSNVLTPATGNFRLVATDAPFSYGDVASAKITISKIDVRSGTTYTTVMDALAPN